MKVLVTGAAGFIGFHLVQRLLRENFQVVGLDSINDYYDINLKYARLAEAGIYAPQECIHSGGKYRVYQPIGFHQTIQSIIYPEYCFVRMKLEDKAELMDLFATEQFDWVINLAAQAGVRYSIENPDAYIQSNIVGFLNILEACRHYPVKHMVYASSSSVYGTSAKVPFSEEDKVDKPVSLYAATKKSNELMAYTYSHLYQIPTTGLRFFTVYGPWGRPDMAPMLFAEAISKSEAIKVFNEGDMERDFTYVDDIVDGIVLAAKAIPENKPAARVFNIGNGSPVNLLEFIRTIENYFGKEAEKIMLPMQAGDVPRTWADTEHLNKASGYQANFTLTKGIQAFADWFMQFHNGK